MSNSNIYDSDSLGERRLGTIVYTEDILTLNPGVIQKVFSKIIPFKIEYDFIAECFEVQAVSPHFEPVEFGKTIPRYDVIIEQQHRKNGIDATYIHFKRAKK